ncbi:hypothetical protein [Microbacterium sp. GXS0129]|uniref:hypothetical protein n=1 Tax=Microbacterium sp. GXS0129 TaxID=3377836 RepID=UPI00383B4146
MGLLGSAVQTAGNIWSNALNAKVQQQTNKMNWQMNQLNNQFNANEAAKNREFQEYMWNRQNAYNSPSAQRERWEEAGRNPYMMDSGGAGNASSSPSGSSASAASPVAMQAARFDFSGVSDAINSFFANQKIAAETKGFNLRNELTGLFGRDREQAEIDQIRGNTNLLNNNPLYRTFMNSQAAGLLGMRSFVDQQQSYAINNRLQMANTALTVLDARAQQIINRYLPSQQQADLWTKLATITEIGTRIGLTRAQIEAQQVRTARDILGYKVDKSTIDSTIEAINTANQYQTETAKGAMPFAWRNGYLSAYNAWKEAQKYSKDIDFKDSGFYRFWNVYGKDILQVLGLVGAAKTFGGRKPSSSSGYPGPGWNSSYTF